MTEYPPIEYALEDFKNYFNHIHSIANVYLTLADDDNPRNRIALIGLAQVIQDYILCTKDTLHDLSKMIEQDKRSD